MSNKNSSFYLKPKGFKKQDGEWHLSLGMHNFRAAERSSKGDSKSPKKKSVLKQSVGGGTRVKRGLCEQNLVRAAQLPFCKGSDKSSRGYRAEKRRLRARKPVDGSPVKSPVKAKSGVNEGGSVRKKKRRVWIINHGVKYLRRTLGDRGVNVIEQFHAVDCPVSPGKEVTMENACKYFIARRGGREVSEEDSLDVDCRLVYRCEYRVKKYRKPSKPRNLKKDLCFLYRKLKNFRKWKQRSTRKERRRCSNTSARRLTRVRHTKLEKVCKTPSLRPEPSIASTSSSRTVQMTPRPKAPVSLTVNRSAVVECSICKYISSKEPGQPGFHETGKCVRHR
jgi:hypothetical protein